MVIAVNTRLLLTNSLEGIGWFAHESLLRITRAHTDHQFVFLFDRPYDDRFIFSDNVTPLVLSPPARHPVLWYWWFEHAVPRALKKVRADVFFSPEAYLSLKTDVPSIATFHDLSLLHYPKHTGWLVRKYIRHYYPRFAQKAERILTVSEFSKKDLEQTLGVPASKIDVVYNGAHEEYRPLSETEIQAVRQQYSDGKPYFLYVGALQPRKNIDRLLQAFDAFKAEQDSDFQLLLAGRKAWMTRSIERTYQQMAHKQDVRFLDYMPLETLVPVVGAAHAMVYVSLFEGFGIPILESLQCGVPVIASNTSSMPEVAGDAGLLVDPLDVQAIQRAMIRMTQDASFYQELQARTLPQVRKFSWNQTANRIWEAIVLVHQS